MDKYEDQYVKAMQEDINRIAKQRQRLKGQEKAIRRALDWYRNLKRQGLIPPPISVSRDLT